VDAEEIEALSEDEIVRRVLAGETELFEDLFHRNSQRVYRAARAIVRNDSDAVDILQESYLRAFRNLNQFEGRAKFSTWLTQITIHEARAHTLRSRARGERREAADPNAVCDLPCMEADPEEQASTQEAKAILEAAIEALPELYRTVFVMRVVEGSTTAETAECLSLSEDVVKTRLLRARALLRKGLRDSLGPMAREAFGFGGERCKRMWLERVFPAIQSAAALMHPRG
jgi:RNA polymerase sigma-70 factor (ECF subfamily)